MTSVVEVDINRQQRRVAELFADPGNNPRWMGDLERVEPISGEPGAAGSVYRLVPKRGNLVFVATVVARELPRELRLVLDAPSVSVSVTGKLLRLSEHVTRLRSEETFEFKGLFGKVLGIMGRGAIRRAHRRHIESFKRFAESQGAP
jgi:hypothetical protein